MAAARIIISLEDENYELNVKKGMKVKWENSTDDCELSLEIPDCVRPKEPGPIKMSPGGRTHWYTVRNDSPSQSIHDYSFDCAVGVPNPRTGTIDVS